MTLLDTAAELQLRLDAASEADAGDELLARCRTVRDELLAIADRWAKSNWKEHFEPAKTLLERVESGDLRGSTATTARARASQIKTVSGLNPVTDQADLESRLKVTGPLACIERVKSMIGELRAAIEMADTEHAALTPEVRDVLRRAAEAGLPLAEITPELLSALRSAGVIEDLVVRRD